MRSFTSWRSSWKSELFIVVLSLNVEDPLNDDVDEEAKTEENLPPSSTTTTESLFGDGDAHLMLLYFGNVKRLFVRFICTAELQVVRTRKRNWYKNVKRTSESLATFSALYETL